MLIPTRILSQRAHDLGELASIIDLDYPQKSLLIEVAGLSSRTFPEEFQYSFVLTDSRGDIVDRRISNDPEYAPKDLLPGAYGVEAVAYDRNLLPSEPLDIRFSIARTPFPWTATALGILLVIAIIALVWAVMERRQIAFRNRELAAARSDLANEAERERSRIARDLHDQTLADLRNLMMMSDRLTPGNPEFRSEIESVSTEIRRICEDLSPSLLENVGLVSALEFLLTRSVANHRFTTSEDANDLVTFSVIVQLHIYRIAQEILTNITHHSDATLVEMSVDVSSGERFALTISDNGRYFRPADAIGVGRGISNIRSRANIINAEIRWAKRPAGGNIFSLEIAGKGGV
jgi:signal transduction histidine kinase